MKRLLILAILLTLGIPMSDCLAQNQETLTLLTYYPAPYGVYKRLEVRDTDASANPLYLFTLHRNFGASAPNAGPFIRFEAEHDTILSPWTLGEIGALGTGGSNRGGQLVFSTTTNASTTLERMRIDENGNVGIGTTDPTTLLTLTTDPAFLSGGDFSPTISLDSDDSFLAIVAGTEYYPTPGFLAGSRNHGGAIGLVGNVFNNSYTFSPLGSVSLMAGWVPGWPNTAGNIYFYSGPSGTGIGSDMLICGNNGFVGIGTDTPARNLHVAGSNPRILVEDTNTETPLNPEINLRSSGNTDWAMYQHAATGDLRFFQGGDKMVLQNSTGNVGIGTSSPSSKVEVIATDTNAIYGRSTSASGSGVSGSSLTGVGVNGNSTSNYGVAGTTSSGQAGVLGTSTASPGVLGWSTNTYGVQAISDNSIAIYGSSGAAAGLGCVGVKGNAYSYGVWGGGANTQVGVYGTGNDGVQGNGIVCDFRAVGTGTNFLPFTGAHDIIFDKGDALIPGMIVVTTGQVYIREKSMSCTLPVVSLTSKVKDTRVFGVFISTQEIPQNYWYTLRKDESLGITNALGEGLVLVTDINGPLSNGDYITTSPIPGYGQKQDDNILYSYTVAKVTQTINWEMITETIEYQGKKYKKTLIAVTYHCG